MKIEETKITNFMEIFWTQVSIFFWKKCLDICKYHFIIEFFEKVKQPPKQLNRLVCGNPNGTDFQVVAFQTYYVYYHNWHDCAEFTKQIIFLKRLFSLPLITVGWGVDAFCLARQNGEDKRSLTGVSLQGVSLAFLCFKGFLNSFLLLLSNCCLVP